MIKSHLFLILIALFGFYSCGPVIRKYDPIMLKSDLSYMPKPMSSDILKTSTYIAAKFGSKTLERGTTNTLFLNAYDHARFGQLNISRGHYFNKWNLAYGFSGFIGEVTNYALDKDDVHYFKTKGFYGGQLQTSASYVMSSDRRS